MRTKLLWLFPVFALGACIHARTTGEAPTLQSDAKAEPRPVRPPKPARATGGSGITPAEATGDHPPIAQRPEQLRKPGGPEKIEAALHKDGFLKGAPEAPSAEVLAAAVQKYQQSKGFAATGYPDNKTLKSLGIKPEDVNRTLEPRSGAPSNTKPGQ